jgi:hypothetical protein
MIVRFVDIGRIIDHHCLEMIVRLVDIGRIIDHHCLEMIVRLVDIKPVYEISNSITKYTYTSITLNT